MVLATKQLECISGTLGELGSAALRRITWSRAAALKVGAWAAGQGRLKTIRQ